MSVLCFYVFKLVAVVGVITKEDFFWSTGFCVYLTCYSCAPVAIAYFPLIRRLTGSLCTHFSTQTVWIWNDFMKLLFECVSRCTVKCTLLPGFKMRNDRKNERKPRFSWWQWWPNSSRIWLDELLSCVLPLPFACSFSLSPSLPALCLSTSWCMGKLPLTSTVRCAQICYFVLCIVVRCGRQQYDW